MPVEKCVCPLLFVASSLVPQLKDCPTRNQVYGDASPIVGAKEDRPKAEGDGSKSAEERSETKENILKAKGARRNKRSDQNHEKDQRLDETDET